MTMTHVKDKYFHVSKRGVMLTLATIGLLLAGAALATYLSPNTTQTADMQNTMPAPKKTAQQSSGTQHRQVAQAQPACNDHNIVGTAIGGIGGGVLGSTLGKGNGKTATTIAGALGGAYVGNQYIPTQNATCK